MEAPQPEWNEPCPSCKAKPILVRLVKDYQNNKSYSTCNKCKHVWSEKQIKPSVNEAVWLNKMAALEDEHGTPSVSKSTTKEKEFCCPDCGKEGKLFKKKDTGEGVKHCSQCGAGWFILNTSRGKK